MNRMQTYCVRRDLNKMALVWQAQQRTWDCVNTYMESKVSPGQRVENGWCVHLPKSHCKVDL